MHYHLIGIGGISMRGVASYLVREGHTVTGCDLAPITLEAIDTHVSHDGRHLAGVDAVVISSAVTPQSAAWPEFLAAERAKIPIYKRAEVIGEITRQRLTLSVSGMHGKSTTTGMLAHILDAAAQDPLVMIGAPLLRYGGATFRWGTGPLVLEADEFDRSFHQFSPDIAILTNIEEEHLDYYRKGLPEILEAFRTFVAGIKPGGTLIAYGDDPNIAQLLGMIASQSSLRVLTYGTDPAVSVQLHDSELGPELSRFSLVRDNELLAEITLAVPGFHNQLNAAAAFLAAHTLGCSAEAICTALASFPGVGQRFERLGSRAGIDYLLDYAHHPTEVSATIAGARAWYGDRPIRVIFQPHQYARTQAHFAEFAAALAEADAAVVTDIFGVAGREEEQFVRAADLSAAIPGSRYLSLADLSATWSSLAQPGEVVIFMGAGRDILALAGRVRDELTGHA